MLTPRKSLQVQRTLLVGGVCLFLYWLVGYRSLCNWTDSLDKQLNSEWDQLWSFKLESGALEGMQSRQLEASLDRVRQRLGLLSAAERTVAARIELEPAIRDRMKEPFQLIDFQNERQLLMEELELVARQRKVALSNGVVEGLPEFVADAPHPTLLWAQLAVVHQLLATTIECSVGAVQTVQLLPTRVHRTEDGTPTGLDEIVVRLEAVGSFPALSRLLLSLPLRQAELKSLGLPSAVAAKPAMFIDRILLRKNPPEVQDELYLDLRISAFVTNGS